MSKQKNEIVSQTEIQNTFSDLTNKMWFKDGDNIKVGENLSKILSGESDTIYVKEFLSGENYKTWKIVITTDDKIVMLKTSKEVK